MSSLAQRAEDLLTTPARHWRTEGADSQRERPLFFYFPICCEAVAESKNQAEASAGTLLPQNPRALGVGRRSRGEQDERDEQWGLCAT